MTSISSPLRLKCVYHHAHSISLSSDSHPLISQFNTHLSLLVASQTVSSSLSSISNKFGGLEDLYDCVDDLLLLPHTQNFFVKECNEKWVTMVLEGHVRLLDFCVRAKDVLSHSRRDVQQLLKVLRRTSNVYDFSKYLASRNKAKQTAKKSLQDLKSCLKNKPINLLALDKDQETVAIANKLNEAEAITQIVMECLLSYVAGKKVKSTCSLISKLVRSNRLENQDGKTGPNEFEDVGLELKLLILPKTRESKNVVTNMQNQLGKMELSIQGLEGGVESLFRRLIRTRVSLLNVLNHK